MQIKLKAVKKVEMVDRVVITLEPLQTDRTGDELSGQLFVATSPENAVLKSGDELVIDIAETPVDPEVV